ncbi:hypothetical protein [Janthinobacterium sp. 78]|uniref:hypothetical protein n=1 Tax=Janthinobacterium sp. 78 TaxID=2135631 RepID=UPI001FAF2470|nr:hypothetical protein [Janthinobacterium sp. 78]
MRISTMAKTWLAALALAAGSSAWAGVQVTFDKPDDYSDVPFSSRDREQVLAGLGNHFTWRSSSMAKSLPAATLICRTCPICSISIVIPATMPCAMKSA